MAEFIVYACPVGPLATQIERYFRLAHGRYGPNAAHAYMPHCTLTGFFHDEVATVPVYTQLLNEILAKQSDYRPDPAITITGMMLTEQFHGLTLTSPWLQMITAVFAQTAHSPTRTDAIRPKDWLHLSLAYGFPAAQHTGLVALAREVVAVDTAVMTAVAWELRFYQRHADHTWTCHHEWPL